MRQRTRVVHLGAAGTAADGFELVPWCDGGHAALMRGSLVLRTTVPSGVTCKVCLAGMARH